jgi:hypothetical protein
MIKILNRIYKIIYKNEYDFKIKNHILTLNIISMFGIPLVVLMLAFDLYKQNYIQLIFDLFILGISFLIGFIIRHYNKIDN